MRHPDDICFTPRQYPSASAAAGRSLESVRAKGDRDIRSDSPSLANQVQRYAETVDTSMSKAIAALVRLGLESQENRKREFFRRLKENLTTDDSSQQDRLVDEFRTDRKSTRL